jgi:hypothetical protein
MPHFFFKTFAFDFLRAVRVFMINYHNHLIGRSQTDILWLLTPLYHLYFLITAHQSRSDLF